MEILIACLIATYVVKNGLIDAAYAVRGKPSPRQVLARQLLERHASRPSRGGDTQPSALRRYVSQLWNDSWDEASRRHDRRIAKQRDRRARRDTAPQGAFSRYMNVRKDAARASWDRRWDTATDKRRAKLLDRRAEVLAAALIAEAETREPVRRAELGVDDTRNGGEVEHTEQVGQTSGEDSEVSPQDSAGATVGGPVGSLEPATIRPIQPDPQEGNSMTASATGENITLSQTYSNIEAWESSTKAAITSLETSIANLEASEVGGSVTGPLGQAQDAFGLALQHFAQARNGLQPSAQIGDLYSSSPDAGDKQYVTG